MKWYREIVDDIWIKSIYRFNDKVFKAEITNLLGEFSYEIRFANKELDNKEIINSMHKRLGFKKLKDAKEEVSKVISLLHYAVDEKPEKIWVFKGVMCGFVELSEMQHLKNAESQTQC